MSVSQKPKLYLLNLYPGTIGVTLTGLTAQTQNGINVLMPNPGSTISYILSPYKYVDISFLISSYKDGVEIRSPDAGIRVASIGGFPPEISTVTLIIKKGYVDQEFDTPDNVLKSYLYNNILQDMDTDLAKVYQELLSLISDYASGKSLSQSTLSDVSSTLQQINNILKNAIQFENQASISSEGVTAYQQVYNNLNQIYESLADNTLTVDELQSLQLPSYSTPEASAIASKYSQFLNNAINIMKSASSQSRSSTSSSTSTSSSSTSSQSSTSASTSTSPSSSSTTGSTSPQSTSTSPISYLTSSTSASSGSASTSTSSQSSVTPPSPTTSPPSSVPSSSATVPPQPTTPPTTISKDKVLAQIRAGDISSLLSGASEIPQDLIPVTNAVIQLYQLYGIPDGTPLSTAVDRLLSDLRDAYYKISNHKQEEVNSQKLTQLLQIYNTLANNGLAPQSQSASKLNELIQASGITPALPAVLGQYYPGRVYSVYSNYV